MAVHALLLQRDAVQVALLARPGPFGLAQGLARPVHALVLPHQRALAALALLAAEEHPGPVDRPVPEVAVAGHA